MAFNSPLIGSAVGVFKSYLKGTLLTRNKDWCEKLFVAFGVLGG